MNDTFQDLINGAAGHGMPLDLVMKIGASDLIYLVPALLIGLWFLPAADRSFNQRLAGATFLGAMLSLGVAFGLGQVYHEARPFISDSSTKLLVHHSADNSFPSDHAALAFGVSGALLMRRRALGIVVLVGAVFIGLARIYVGVHWPLDILTSAVIGLATGALISLLVPVLAAPQRWLARLLPPLLITSP
jgi:undecaprenyl-diphosphatase